MRMKAEARKEDLLAAALPLAEIHGYMHVTRSQIATAAGASGPILNHHFGTMKQFRRDLMRYAIKAGSLAVVAQGLSAGDPQARKAPEALRKQALAALL